MEQYLVSFAKLMDYKWIKTQNRFGHRSSYIDEDKLVKRGTYW